MTQNNFAKKYLAAVALMMSSPLILEPKDISNLEKNSLENYGPFSKQNYSFVRVQEFPVFAEAESCPVWGFDLGKYIKNKERYIIIENKSLEEVLTYKRLKDLGEI